MCWIMMRLWLWWRVGVADGGTAGQWVWWVSETSQPQRLCHFCQDWVMTRCSVSRPADQLVSQPVNWSVSVSTNRRRRRQLVVMAVTTLLTTFDVVVVWCWRSRSLTVSALHQMAASCCDERWSVMCDDQLLKMSQRYDLYCHHIMVASDCRSYLTYL